MEVLVLDGNNYVKASKAARDLGYATDYVGQLCRSGQVDAHLIGRTWYVNQDKLSTHRVEKKRMSRVKAREYAKRTIEEYRKQNQKSSENIVIQYKNDEESLIPETRKLIPQSTDIKHPAKVPDETGDVREVINKGSKVLMEGRLNVVDVTDGEVDDVTTVLHPKIQHVTERKDDLPTEEHLSREDNDVVQKKSFVDKLQQESVAIEHIQRTPLGTDDEQSDVTPYTPIPTNVLKQETVGPTILTCVLGILVCGIIATMTLPLSKIITYSKDQVGTVTVTSGLSFSTEDANEIVRSKI